jgi:protein-disulfide isomerase
VTDINDIIAFGVMATPALVVDGEIRVAGRVPTAEAIKPLLV